MDTNNSMKKIVCEVCGGMNVKKENGVFVCKDCGIEYSLDEVKKLFVEVEESTEVSLPSETNKTGLNSTAKEETIEKLKYALEYIDFVHSRDIKASSLFNVSPEIANMNLLAMSPDEIRSLKTYRVEPADDDFAEKNNTDSMYKSLLFIDKYNTYNNKREALKREKITLGLKEQLGLTEGEHFYKLTFNFKSPSGIDKVERDRIYASMFETTIKKTIASFLNLNLITGSYTFERLLSLLSAKKYKLDLMVEKCVQKKSLFGEKTIIEETNEYSLSEVILRICQDASKVDKNEVIEFFNPYIKEYADRIEKAREFLISTITPYYEIKNYSDSIYSEIPEKYRNKDDMLCLISLFVENRIQTVGEGLNMIDTYQFRSDVKERLSDIKDKLDVLDKKMNIVGSALYEMDTKVKSVSSKVEKLKKVSTANLVVSLLL